VQIFHIKCSKYCILSSSVSDEILVSYNWFNFASQGHCFVTAGLFKLKIILAVALLDIKFYDWCRSYWLETNRKTWQTKAFEISAV